MRNSIKIGLFACELVDYIFQSNGKKLRLRMLNHFKSVTSKSGFDKNIGEAVCAILYEKGDGIFKCYLELEKTCKCSSVKKDLTYFALNAVPTYFPEGYDPENFLCFCTILIGVAVSFFEIGHCEAAEAAAEVIQSVLTYFTLTSDFDEAAGLPELIRMSKYIFKRLERKSKNKTQLH